MVRAMVLVVVEGEEIEEKKTSLLHPKAIVTMIVTENKKPSKLPTK